MTSSPPFSVDDFVRRRSNPDQAGAVVASSWDDQTEEWIFTVRFGNARRAVPESELELLPDETDPWEELAGGTAGGAAAFKELLTFERLRKPPSRIAASFGSAKASFYPFQFKPLLKFLENPKQRILICDDVGLGKTIEAGYILREIQARHGLDRALIVVPARLRSKWKAELDRRFDEKFEIVKRNELRGLLDRIARGLEPGPFRWIVSYESARAPEIIEALDEYRPAIDLVIVDEAHRMRNSSTYQHRLGVELGKTADAMVFLTATPVQTSRENLFRLLQILDPDDFTSTEVFEEQAEANKPLVRALTLLRANPPEAEGVISCLDDLASNRLTRKMANSEYFQSIRNRALELEALPRDEIVELQRDLSELGVTSHILSRTRKVDAMPDRPPRHPQSVAVEFEEEERRFYDAVGDLYAELRPDLGSWGFMMAVLQVFKYTASCIPAAVELFRQRADEGIDIVTSVEAEIDFEPEGDEEVFRTTEPDLSVRFSAGIRGLVDSLAPPEGVDSKFDRFDHVLGQVWAEDSQNDRALRKVVVFSTYPRTLRYLSRRLLERGIATRMIHGKVPMDEREERITEFANDEGVRVLLSSEVGGEGIDLQFASVIVNYDLPWNPMVVEQRIGRLDRIGQLNPIAIVNLFAKDSIEERILGRLYDRILTAVDTLGDIDPILGGKIDQLAIDALSGRLSKQDQKIRAVETADAIIQEEQNAQLLTAEADGLMAADQSFLDEVESLVGHGRIPLGEELRQFLDSYLKSRYAGSRVPSELTSATGRILIAPDAANDIHQTMGTSPEFARLIRNVHRGGFEATFDQDVALVNPRAELIYARHPLVQFVFAQKEKASDTHHRGFHVRLELDRRCHASLETVETGRYAFFVVLYDIEGARPRSEIVTLLLGHGATDVLDAEACQQIFAELVVRASDRPEGSLLDPEWVRGASQALMSKARQHRGDLQNREERLNAGRIERKRATLEATHDARVVAAKSRLETLRTRVPPADEFPIRMAEANLTKRTEERSAALAMLEAQTNVRVESQEIAVGVVDIV